MHSQHPRVTAEITNLGGDSAICLEVIVDLDDVPRLKCKHVFHESCLDNWFQRHHNNCPLCKATFIKNAKFKFYTGGRCKLGLF